MFVQNKKFPVKMCIKYFSPENNWDNLFVDTSFQGIIKDCKNISLEIFAKIDSYIPY